MKSFRSLSVAFSAIPTRARAQGWKETLLDFYWATWEIGFSNVLYFNLGGNFRGPEIQFKISNVLIT